MTVDGYEKCEIADEVIERINYNKGEDKENTSCSVFCSHGAGIYSKFGMKLKVICTHLNNY